MMMRLTRNDLILWVIGLYLVLNYGFMQLRIPPVGGGGVPLGELVLLLVLLKVNYLIVYSRLSSVVFLFPFIVWWAYGLGRALAGVPEFGMWALRDASHVIESLFIIVGFIAVSRKRDLERFFYWLPRVLVVISVYSIGFIFKDTLQGWSPSIVAGGGHEVPVLFAYANTAQLLLWASVYILLFKVGGSSIPNYLLVLIATVLIGYAVLLFQARITYLQLIVLFLLLLLYRRELIGQVVFSLFFILVFLLILPLTGIQLEGRLGQELSVDFIAKHIATIGGISADGVVGSAAGVHQRIGWWTELFFAWTSSVKTFMFGLGYGMPLIDYTLASGAVVREPHNSYISILARLGVIGATAWLWMHLILIVVWINAYRECTHIRWKEGQNRLLILLVFFVLIWVLAIGQDAFEKPYNAIPYYFFWGVILRFMFNLKEKLRRQHEEPHADITSS